MSEEYSFSINPFLLKNNDYINIVERSIFVTLTHMYSDGVLNLAPKDVKIVDTDQKEVSNHKEVDRVVIHFQDKE